MAVFMDQTHLLNLQRPLSGSAPAVDLAGDAVSVEHWLPAGHARLTVTDGFQSLTLPRKARQELPRARYGSFRLQNENRAPLSSALNSLSLDSMAGSGTAARHRATRSILKNGVRHGAPWNRKVTWQPEVKVIIVDSKGNVVCVAERLRSDSDVTTDSVDGHRDKVTASKPGSQSLRKRMTSPLPGQTNGVHNKLVTRRPPTPKPPSQQPATPVSRSYLSSPALQRAATGPARALISSPALSRPPTPSAAPSRAVTSSPALTRSLNSSLARSVTSSPVPSKTRRSHDSVTSMTRRTTSTSDVQKERPALTNGHLFDPTERYSLDSDIGKVNITFSPSGKASETRLKFVLDLGTGYDANNIVVKAHTNGSRLRIMASRTEDIEGDASIVHEFNQKFALPMCVDPHALEARLDTSGCLTVEAPLLQGGGQGHVRRTASALS